MKKTKKTGWQITARYGRNITVERTRVGWDVVEDGKVLLHFISAKSAKAYAAKLLE